MHYLFGDSTPSKLTTNFLEFLKDAVDFAVFALKTDDRIKRGQTQAASLRRESVLEIERLERFIAVVTTSIEQADKGAAESPTANCASRLLALTVDTHRSAANGIQQRLAEDIAAIESDEAAARAACVKALESMLLPHDPPDASSVTRIVLGDDGRYSASFAARAEFGLEWTMALAIPDANLWASPLLVSRIAPQMEIKVPQLSGWISKEVKIKPLRLERHVFTELVDDGRTVKVELRAEPERTTGFGFEVVFNGEPRIVAAIKHGPAEDASNGKFDPAPEDVGAIIELITKLRTAKNELPRKALVAASTAGADFVAQPTFIDVVERLIDMMAPIVRELSERSLTPNELIMRRPLGNDRREEIFVSKALLRDKYSALSAPLRSLFTPLGLDDGTPVSMPVVASAPPPAASAPPPPIASVPPPPVSAPHVVSAPPPPVASAPPPAVASAPPPAIASPPPPVASAPPPPVASVPPPPLPQSVPPPLPPPSSPEAVAVALAQQELPRSQPPPPPTRSVPPLSGGPTRVIGARVGPLPPARMPPRKPTPQPMPPPDPDPDPGTIEVSVEVSVEDEEATPPPVKVESAFPPPLPNGQARNQALVAELKRIHALSRNQQFDEAYIGYRELFSDLGFSSYKPEEQRQALRLMVLPKAKPPTNELVADAHRVALTRIKTLTEVFDDAGDYELLGVAHLTLDEVEEARVAFTTALGIERRRNPQSELVGTLMKRVSEI